MLYLSLLYTLRESLWLIGAQLRYYTTSRFDGRLQILFQPTPYHVRFASSRKYCTWSPKTFKMLFEQGQVMCLLPRGYLGYCIPALGDEHRSLSHLDLSPAWATEVSNCVCMTSYAQDTPILGHISPRWPFSLPIFEHLLLFLARMQNEYGDKLWPRTGDVNLMCCWVFVIILAVTSREALRLLLVHLKGPPSAGDSTVCWLLAHVHSSNLT